MYEALITGIHYEPLRPNRALGIKDKYEFAHGYNNDCVYDAETMDFVKEIKVGTKPDCHATSLDNSYLYIACREGLYCISQETLEVEKVLTEIGPCYATNTMPNGDLLVHDLRGGVQLVKDITDMNKIHVEPRIPVIPNGEFRCEIGGKGNFLEDGKYYLVCGWHQKKLYLFNVEEGFTFEDFTEVDELLNGSDDLVINSAKTKAYCACHKGQTKTAHVAVIDIASHKIAKIIPTGVGTCGLTMTNDERYVVCSNDQEGSISVIDTETDEIVNKPCAEEGFRTLGLISYIQGISCGADNSIFVYGCSGNGAIVRFFDIANSNKYIVSSKIGKYEQMD